MRKASDAPVSPSHELTYAYCSRYYFPRHRVEAWIDGEES